MFQRSRVTPYSNLCCSQGLEITRSACRAGTDEAWTSCPVHGRHYAQHEGDGWGLMRGGTRAYGLRTDLMDYYYLLKD